MRVLHLLKCAAYLSAAVAYGLIVAGYHGPLIYAVLCASHLLPFVAEAARMGRE
jgi:hypothetical protein